MSKRESNFTVVGEIGEILVDLLKDSFSKCDAFTTPITDIALGSPDIEDNPQQTAKPQIIVFLYHIDKNAHFEHPDDLYTKLALELYYLIIAIARDKAIEHKIAGKIAEVFNAHKVLFYERYQNDKPGFYAGYHDAKVNIASMSIDEKHKLWTGFPKIADKTFIPYIVRPVIIDCGDPEIVLVNKREFIVRDKQYYKLEE